MPYKRTYRRRKTARRTTRRTNVRAVARQEAKKAVARAIETKIFDTNYTAQAVDYNAGFVASFTVGMIRGTGEDQYIGDRITPCGLAIRAQLTRSDTTQLMRILIIQNKGGGVPLLSTLLHSTGNITAPLSPLDKDYNATYSVIYDKMWSMDAIRETTKQVIIKIPAKRLKTLWFNDAAGAIEKGGIYICAISDSAAVTHPTLDYRARFYYKDA